MADIYPFDGSTPVGQLRVLLKDTERYDYNGDGTNVYRLTDDVLQTFYTICDDKLFLAAAYALRSLAMNEALISKVIRTEDLQTDGAKLSTELRLLADDYEQRQGRLDVEADSADAFEIVDHQYPYYNVEW